MTPHLLLDTCAMIWLAGIAGRKEAVRVAALIDAAFDDGQTIWVSPITAWEFGLLASKGRLAITVPVRTWLDNLMQTPGLKWADLSPDVLLASNALPGQVQGDPADRIIVATAREFGMRVVTKDRLILDYAGQGHVMALEC